MTSTLIDHRIRVIDLTLGELLAALAPSRAALPPTPVAKDYYTVSEAAQLLGNTERHVRRLIARGRLEKRKVAFGRGSSRVLIPRASIERLLEEGVQ